MFYCRQLTVSVATRTMNLTDTQWLLLHGVNFLLGGQTKEGIYYAEVDLNEVDQVRNTIPVFQDRRTDLY